MICWFWCLLNAKYLEGQCACSVFPLLLYIRWWSNIFCSRPRQLLVDNFSLDNLGTKSMGEVNLQSLHFAPTFKVWSTYCVQITFLGAFPPVDFLAVCFTRAILLPPSLNSSYESISGNGLYVFSIAFTKTKRKESWFEVTNQVRNYKRTIFNIVRAQITIEVL